MTRTEVKAVQLRGGGELIQQLTQLVQTQTAMVAAQTRAMSALSLPPIPTYSGEGEQCLEEGFERWVEQFEERAPLAGWSEDLRHYHLKMKLSKTAFQTYRLLPDNVKASYSATVSALRSKFKPRRAQGNGIPSVGTEKPICRAIRVITTESS